MLNLSRSDVFRHRKRSVPHLWLKVAYLEKSPELRAVDRSLQWVVELPTSSSRVGMKAFEVLQVLWHFSQFRNHRLMRLRSLMAGGSGVASSARRTEQSMSLLDSEGQSRVQVQKSYVAIIQRTCRKLQRESLLLLEPFFKFVPIYGDYPSRLSHCFSSRLQRELSHWSLSLTHGATTTFHGPPYSSADRT